MGCCDWLAACTSMSATCGLIFIWWCSLVWAGGRGCQILLGFRLEAFLKNINLFILIGGYLLYSILVVLPYIDMNLPQVYMCSPSWTPPPTSLPIPSLWVIPVHQPQAPCLMHRTWTGDLFHIWYCTCFNAILPNHPTLSLSHRVQKTVLYICVSFAVLHTGLLSSF